MNNTTAYLIGNGPSLNKVDITKLKDKSTISFNRAYIAYEEWGFDPTYYMIIDSYDLQGYGNDIRNLLNNSSIKEFFIKNDFVTFFNDGNEKIGDQKITFIESTDFDFMPDNELGFGVAFRAIPILIQKGYKKIVLLGCDCVYQDGNSIKVEGNGERKGIADDDQDHFRKDYYGKDIEYLRPMSTSEHLRIWGNIKKIIDERFKDVTIYSSVPNGVINNTFKYIDFEESLKL